MGQLRTANNRRNRAIRHAVTRAQATAGAIPSGVVPSITKTARKPVEASS